MLKINYKLSPSAPVESAFCLFSVTFHLTSPLRVRAEQTAVLTAQLSRKSDAETADEPLASMPTGTANERISRLRNICNAQSGISPKKPSARQRTVSAESG